MWFIEPFQLEVGTSSPFKVDILWLGIKPNLKFVSQPHMFWIQQFKLAMSQILTTKMISFRLRFAIYGVDLFRTPSQLGLSPRAEKPLPQVMKRLTNWKTNTKWKTNTNSKTKWKTNKMTKPKTSQVDLIGLFPKLERSLSPSSQSVSWYHFIVVPAFNIIT